MQCCGSTGAPLINQEQVTIGAQRGELFGVKCSRADRILARASHQNDDWIRERRSGGGGDHCEMDWQPTTVWLIGILRDIEHATPNGSGDIWKLARRAWQVCGACGTRAKHE
jgi:hypothetical protein